ncbi:MAG: glycosyltransferase family 2 protein [Deltaproteobacteria bacterium]|nr:glycosyltransferase family 2 protein [Deltaproteobacteria bacterium]
MTAAFRPCGLVPTFDNPATLRRVVERISAFVPDVVVVDDGSAEEGRKVVEALGKEGLAHVHHRAQNGGKGAAVKTGFEVAHRLGFTHAVQVDADGQHAIEDLPRFLDAARAQPEALVLASPVFDATAPKSRLRARQITCFWTNLETGGKVIEDPMCGFRVYPVAAALASGANGDRMDFDPEIAVRLVWMGLKVVNLPTRVHYVSKEEGGVSHFQMFWDNVRISWMHTRMVALALLRLLGGGPQPRKMLPP